MPFELNNLIATRMKPMPPNVVAVHSSPNHAFSKAIQPGIELVIGHGVKGDAHSGVTVKHRSRVAKDPSQPNLRQVHLLQAELLDELSAKGLTVSPGQMGENITTRGLALLGLGVRTRLRIGLTAVVELTGLRNPCGQIESFKPGLLAAVLDKTPDGALVRKAGVMGIVVTGGLVHPGDGVVVIHQPAVYTALQPV